MSVNTKCKNEPGVFKTKIWQKKKTFYDYLLSDMCGHLRCSHELNMLTWDLFNNRFKKPQKQRSL